AHPVSLKIVTADRPGVLAQLSKSFTEMGINISGANCVTTEDQQAVNTFQVAVVDNEQLKGVIKQLESINGVYSVSRLRTWRRSRRSRRGRPSAAPRPARRRARAAPCPRSSRRTPR